MSDVVDFPEKPQVTTVSGPCVCMRCRHRWEAVVAVGTLQMQCPKCLTFWGVFDYPFMPQQGQTRWLCTCGGEFFCIVPAGAGCLRCGKIQQMH